SRSPRSPRSASSAPCARWSWRTRRSAIASTGSRSGTRISRPEPDHPAARFRSDTLCDTSDRLSDLIDRRPRQILLLALAWTALAAIVGGPVAGRLSASGTNFEDPGSPSVAARKQLERASGSSPNPAVFALVRTNGSMSVATTRASVERVAARLARDPAVAHVVSFYDA